MVQFDPSSERIYYDQDVSLIRKWTDEVYIETFHWCLCRGCKTMYMDGDFQHVHFLTTLTVINVISDMLSLILPSVFSILCYSLRYITYTRTHVHIRTQDLVHYIFHFFKLDNAFTHPPSLLPVNFCHTLFLTKKAFQLLRHKTASC